MINNYKYASPFMVFISFHKVIESLEILALDDVQGHMAMHAKSLVETIKTHQEFNDGIDSFEFIDNNKELIKVLLLELFPNSLTLNEIKAVTLPFYEIAFNYSERFKLILKNAGVKFDLGIRDMDEHQFYIMNCILILNSYYKQNIDFWKPIFYDIPDKNGIMKHYRALYNADFLEIYPVETTAFLSQIEINNLVDNYNDLDLWKKAFPKNSWIMKGFAIISLVDVTTESAISSLKTNLLTAKTLYNNNNESFESIFRSLFKIPDLKVGFTFYDKENDSFVRPPSRNSNFESFILLNEDEADCKNALCGCSYENLIEKNNHFIIPDIKHFHSLKLNDKLATHLLNLGFESFLLASVTNRDNKLFGIIELASPSIRALNSISVNKLDLILPYISETMEKISIDMMNQLEAVIQKEYTAIHPSVYWKFKEEALKFLNSKNLDVQHAFKEIVFKEVYPLYGQIDIKGSSENRNFAIIKDLKSQIQEIIKIIVVLNDQNKIVVLEEKMFELQCFLVELEKPFKNNLEQIIHQYIETEIHSFLNYNEFSVKAKKMIKEYFTNIDPKTGMFFQTRKNFEETVTCINMKLATILDERQKMAQEIFPHYFERFKTDGVEHNLYIGESIEPNITFNAMYLHNLRLWQLETLCEMELEHHRVKKTFAYELDVTSLILAFSAPISIRFRMDEKRFDVDGSYNARFEVVKKRIDKALVKNSNERITQKEKITIVYSNAIEEKEYIKHIKYLQHKNLLHDEIEKLEIQDLQGISGLKAIRVKVKNSSSILYNAEAYIINLFNEKLDSSFSFHNLEHTKTVVKGIETICKAEKINEETTLILVLAAWFHDAGYIGGCEMHEKLSIEIALDFLIANNLAPEIQQKVSGLIQATTYNYKPKSKLEKIMKDADNFHLTNKNYPKTLELLRMEWENSIDKKYCNKEWFFLNAEFLKNHKYYTKYAQNNWQNLKEINLKIIEEKLLNQL
jgi:predicted metal-dependent HD superfamily phosphohydrolase